MNEKGFILPLMLVISLVFASLLLTMADRLESQVFSYQRRQLFQKIALLEKETVHRIYGREWEPGIHTLSLANGLSVALNIQEQEEALEIGYHFIYNGYMSFGTLNRRKTDEKADCTDWDDGQREDDLGERLGEEAETELDRYGSVDRKPDGDEYP